MGFTADSFDVDVPQHQLVAFDAAWRWLAEPSGCWTGAQKVAMAEVARNASPRPVWDRRPDSVGHLPVDVPADVPVDVTLDVPADVPADVPVDVPVNVAVDVPADVPVEVAAGRDLSPLVVDTVERIAVEAGAIRREWALEVIGALGEVAYAELAAVVAILVPIDRACRLLGRELEPLPSPLPGAPTGERAETTVDIGAYVPAADGFFGPNVAKSLSVAPTANIMRLGVVRALYSGDRFGELRWDDGALNRPQVELIAARTSALNECFY